MPVGKTSVPRVREGQPLSARATQTGVDSINRATTPNALGFQGENMSVFRATPKNSLKVRIVMITETMDAAMWDGSQMTVATVMGKEWADDGDGKYSVGEDATFTNRFLTQVTVTSGKARVAAVNEDDEIINVDCEEFTLPAAAQQPINPFQGAGTAGGLLEQWNGA